MQHQCTAARAKCNPYCSVLLCKTGPQQALSHCIHTYGDLLLIQVCSDPAPLHCSTAARAKCTPHCSVVLCKRGPQQALSKCIYTYREICSSYRCAVMQHQCTAALVRARCKPHCSVMLCKTGSQQAVWHCIYTYEDLLLIQVCSDALQNRLTAGSVALHLHLWRSALHTGVQGCNTNALQHLSGQNAFPTVQCCSAKQAHSRQCGTAFTPMDTWCSYNCSGTQHQCTAALFKAKSLLFSAALQNRPTAGTESLHLHAWRSALDTGVQ